MKFDGLMTYLNRVWHLKGLSQAGEELRQRALYYHVKVKLSSEEGFDLQKVYCTTDWLRKKWNAEGTCLLIISLFEGSFSTFFFNSLRSQLEKSNYGHQALTACARAQLSPLSFMARIHFQVVC